MAMFKTLTMNGEKFKTITGEWMKEIYDDLSDLLPLQTINFVDNHIAAIPESIQILTNLTHLNLENNKLQ